MVNYAVILFAALMCTACTEKAPPSGESPALATQANEPVLPGTAEATQALLAMLDMQELPNAEAKLGTCIPAIEVEHPKQMACTVALKVGAGSSETQVDFYRRGDKWMAKPSKSQDHLPFPDPKL